MRLTLRTMLAYLDEQLDPPQMEEIGAKIRESGVASGMIDRIRASMRKHRMEAPRVEGRGIGKDANSVAEYLDNVLDKDEIPEIEQLCLESDMHLAEVAACHQMLSLLPKVDLEVDSELRDRIYAVPSRLAERESEVEEEELVRPRHAEVRALGDGQAKSHGKKKKKKRPQGVPEYFKDSGADSRRWLPLLLTAGVVLAGLAIGAYATRDQWLKSPSKQTAAAGNDVKAPEEEKAAEQPSPETTAAVGEEKANPKEETAEEGSKPLEENTAVAKPAEEEKKPEAESKPSPAEETSEMTEGEMPPAAKPEETKPEDSSAAVAHVAARTPMMIGGSPGVVWDREAKGWTRMHSGGELAWDSTVVLVGTRLNCKTASGLGATIVGPSEVRFEKAQGVDATWSLDSGRLLFDAENAGGASVTANVAGRLVSLKFVSPDGQAAIEAVRKVPPGADPTSPDEFPATVSLSILRGAVEVKIGDAAGKVVEASAESVAMTISPAGETEEATAPGAPLWVDAQTASESVKQASQELAESLAKPTPPLSITLLELVGDKRVNVSALAAQALAQLGDIKPLCDQFREKEHRLAWRTNHAFLKQLLQSSPANAEMVRGQLEEHFPSEYPAVYRVLRGFSKEQFEEEGQEFFLTCLQSESTMVRVLAHQTLVDLVGPRGKYAPEAEASARAKNISSWVDAFNSGKLKVKEAEEK